MTLSVRTGLLLLLFLNNIHKKRIEIMEIDIFLAKITNLKEQRKPTLLKMFLLYYFLYMRVFSVCVCTMCTPPAEPRNGDQKRQWSCSWS